MYKVSQPHKGCRGKRNKFLITDLFMFQPHRVLMVGSEESKTQVRQSIAYFCHPNDDSMIEPLDGSKKYPPISALDYINERFAGSY